jgi:hypothetical protein
MMPLCPHCDEPVDGAFETIPHVGGDLIAVPRRWHPECAMRNIVGGVNHLRGRCVCCGGVDPPDPPGLSRREAARMACAVYREQGVRKF